MRIIKRIIGFKNFVFYGFKYGFKYWFDEKFRRTIKNRRGSQRKRKIRGSGFLVRVKYIKQKLFLRDGNKCGWCGVVLKFKTATVDHFLDVDLGGGNEMQNLRLLCNNCNRDKNIAKQKNFLKYQMK